MVNVIYHDKTEVQGDNYFRVGMHYITLEVTTMNKYHIMPTNLPSTLTKTRLNTKNNQYSLTVTVAD